MTGIQDILPSIENPEGKMQHKNSLKSIENGVWSWLRIPVCNVFYYVVFYLTVSYCASLFNCCNCSPLNEDSSCLMEKVLSTCMLHVIVQWLNNRKVQKIYLWIKIIISNFQKKTSSTPNPVFIKTGPIVGWYFSK